MKPMVYKERLAERQILDTGYFFGYLYYILNLGTHPTAYVRIPKEHRLYSIDNYNDMPIDCHGGLTFMQDYLKIENNQEIEGKFIGWDYAHVGDYYTYLGDETDKKWSTEEIQHEVKDVCAQLKEME